MTTSADHFRALEVQACSALDVGDLETANGAIAGLASQIGDDPEAMRRLAESLSRVAEVAGTKGSTAETVCLWALWSQVWAFRRIRDFSSALEVVEAMRHKMSAEHRTFEARWRRDVDLARIGLLYDTGSFSEAASAGAEYITCFASTGSEDEERVVQALWFQYFAAERLEWQGVGAGSGVRDQIRRRLILTPSLSGRLAAARGAQTVLRQVLEAQDGAAVMAVTAELERAFSEEVNRDAEIVIGGILLEAADWFREALGAFLHPELVERALSITGLVIDRFEDADTRAGVRLLASARWGQYLSLAGLCRTDEVEAAIERLVSMGTPAAEVISEQLAERGDTDSAEMRPYVLNLLILRALALSSADGQLDEAIAVLDAAIERYAHDDDPVVQQCVTWAHAIRLDLERYAD